MPLRYSTANLELTKAQTNGTIIKSLPFFAKFGDDAHFVFTEPLVQLADSYQPLALNTARTINGASVVMCGDTEPSDIGAGVNSFDRMWANVPATHYDYEIGSFTFPGYFGGRPPTSEFSAVQIEYAYYLVGAGTSYANAGALPITQETRLIYYGGLDVSILSGGEIYVGPATTPSDAAYGALVTADAATPNSYSIVIDSSPVHYMGNIWAVVTRRTKAK